MTADTALVGALADLARALQTAGRPAMIIGGIAAIARGVPRQTVDIDATVWAEALILEDFLRVLATFHITPRIADAVDFARERQVLLLRHEPTGTPLEITIATLPFEHDAISRATPVDFGGVRIPVATPEDLVVYKTVAWRDRDRADVERLLVRHGREMDLQRLRAAVRQFAEALEEPERVDAFERLLHRALES